MKAASEFATPANFGHYMALLFLNLGITGQHFGSATYGGGLWG